MYVGKSDISPLVSVLFSPTLLARFYLKHFYTCLHCFLHNEIIHVLCNRIYSTHNFITYENNGRVYILLLPFIHSTYRGCAFDVIAHVRDDIRHFQWQEQVYTCTLTMVKSCCAVGCVNKYRKSCGLSFYPFPKDPERRTRWVAAVARKNWTPNEYS